MFYNYADDDLTYFKMWQDSLSQKNSFTDWYYELGFILIEKLLPFALFTHKKR